MPRYSLTIRNLQYNKYNTYFQNPRLRSDSAQWQTTARGSFVSPFTTTASTAASTINTTRHGNNSEDWAKGKLGNAVIGIVPAVEHGRSNPFYRDRNRPRTRSQELSGELVSAPLLSYAAITGTPTPLSQYSNALSQVLQALLPGTPIPHFSVRCHMGDTNKAALARTCPITL